MSTIKLVLDKRRKLKDNTFNLSVRVCNKGKVQYLPIPDARFTEAQHTQVFVRESKDEQSINWRVLANGFKTMCERIDSEMSVYNPKRFRELVYSKDKELPKTLLLKDLFCYYIDNYEGITLKTRQHFRLSLNKLDSFHPELTVQDVTPEFLRHFDLEQQKAGLSRATIDGIFRNLRRVINYFMLEKKLIPKTYEYPFGRGGYSIKSFFGRKLVMRNDEIQKVVDFKDFNDDKEMEYARDIWLFLYRANGINFADLIRMRWDSMQGGYLIFFRRKTQSTRKNNIKPLTVPITPKLQELIDKVGVKDSPFILGMLEEGFAENTYENLSHKIRSNINEKLLEISKKLNLSVPLKLKTARDCYATTLKRAGVSKDNIGEMLGHSNSVVTEHYLASLDIEKTHEINMHIL
ncbi:MAG: tyrosine-type recombinase/integrase [Bacteroidales bacterium]|jgi:integrase|nr:tyrosine-type recombinase/integrase [Bacteroidales bacterium]